MISNDDSLDTDVLYHIISDLVKSPHLSVQTTIHGVNFIKGVDLYLIDVVTLKSGSWINEIGGSYHEDCYKVSFSYNHMYYSHTVTHSVYSQYLRDYRINQVLES